MQPKWILYSVTFVGLLIVVLTNVIQEYGSAFPPMVVTVINIALPSLLMLRRYLGDMAAGLGEPPLTLLPPTAGQKVESLESQKGAVVAELATAKADAKKER